MKHLLPLFLLLTATAHAQDSTQFQKLSTRFQEAFYTMDSLHADETYYQQLSAAAQFILEAHPGMFGGAQKKLATVAPGLNKLELVNRVLDSLLDALTAEGLWKGHESVYGKMSPLLRELNDRTCPCYTNAIRTQTRDLANALQRCEADAAKDPAFRARMTIGIRSLSPAEQQELLRVMGRYTYQACAAMHRYLSDGIKQEGLDRYLARLFVFNQSVDETALQYWKQNRKDSLQRIFPDYASFEKDLAKAAAQLRPNASYSLSHRNEALDFIYTKTWVYRHGVTGRIEYRVTTEGENWRLVSLRFVAADKIPQKEKEAAIRDAEDIPPPPPPSGN